MGTVRNTGGSYSTSNRSLFASSQEGVQHRQTHACLSGKVLEVGTRDGNIWRASCETVVTDERINGAHVRRSEPFPAERVSPDEEYDGETNCQDNAWYAVHVPFLSEKT